MVPPLPLAFWVSVCITGPDFPASGARAQCSSQSNVLTPLIKEIKHFRWALKHFLPQPNTYQDFNMKCWRCHHTHPIPQGPGLPGNSFHTWNHLLGFGTCIACSETQLGRVAREGGSHLWWLLSLLNQGMKIGISIITGKSKLCDTFHIIYVRRGWALQILLHFWAKARLLFRVLESSTACEN